MKREPDRATDPKERKISCTTSNGRQAGGAVMGSLLVAQVSVISRTASMDSKA
jgi:hypothetical protein